MKQERLAKAIRLREEGRAKQDQGILEQARALLLELGAADPDDAEITYQTAIVHDNLGLERESIPFYVKALQQDLTGLDYATQLTQRQRAFLRLGSPYRGLGEYQK